MLVIVTSCLLALFCLQGVDSNPTRDNAESEVNEFSGMVFRTPATPSPNDVNCYVEIPSTVRLPGRCSHFGQLYTCQAGVHLSTSEECEQLLSAP